MPGKTLEKPYRMSNVVVKNDSHHKTSFTQSIMSYEKKLSVYNKHSTESIILHPSHLTLELQTSSRSLENFDINRKRDQTLPS